MTAALLFAFVGWFFVAVVVVLVLALVGVFHLLGRASRAVNKPPEE